MPSPRRTPASDRRRRSAGFTILEVMLAAFVLAYGISTSITVLQRGFIMLDTARNLTTAGQIMISQLEQVRMFDWATVSAYPTESTAITLDPIFTSNASVGNRFTVTRTVSTYATNILQITFTVSWKAYDGRTLSRTMTTYYARYGLHDFVYNGA